MRASAPYRRHCHIPYISRSVQESSPRVADLGRAARSIDLGGSDVSWRGFAAVSILQKTLDEEKATDKKLTALAESKVNLRAAS
jgi:hypothetical protein